MRATPTNGVDRCDCGCKYWDDGYGTVDPHCMDCGARFDEKSLDTEPQTT